MSGIAEAVQTLAEAIARIVVAEIRRDLLNESSLAAIRAAIAPRPVAEVVPQPEPKSEPVCQPADPACSVEVSTPSPKTDPPPLPRSEGKKDAVAPTAEIPASSASATSLPSPDGSKNSAPIKRVRLSAEGVKTLFRQDHRRDEKRGTVTWDAGRPTVRVLWDGSKTPMTLHRDFVEPADDPIDLPMLPKPLGSLREVVEAAEPPQTAPAERIKAWIEGKSSAPEVNAPPPPAPIVPSKVAEALAEYTRKRHQVQSALKPKPDPTPAPANDYESPNARRPRVFGGSALAPATIHFKPDAPAAKRGAVVVEIPGEPAPGRSALDQRRAEEAERAAKGGR